MSPSNVYTIEASDVTLGPVLARGSPRPGVTLYQAKLQLGDQCMTVSVSSDTNDADSPLQAYMAEFALQVAVKRLQTCGITNAAESQFLKEKHTLRMASGICHRACRMLGCCKLDGDACIVMTLYPNSAAKLLEEAQGEYIE